ncbi:hypothetical protein F511_24307 [Dorcoceras hygrometricum]|uniref:Uncharacterized protein n=1 Tax=Dorcoceras hygrometricum TaxID=472368 RepID=A0A2Z7CT59_9LAMI|nr:hypothetical protein F511_24307 [Dorcoceras hygrometricum]
MRGRAAIRHSHLPAGLLALMRRVSSSLCWLSSWTGPTGPGLNDDIHRCDFIATTIADQIGPIDSVSETECYDVKNNFSDHITLNRKMTVLPLNSGKPRGFRKSQQVPPANSNPETQTSRITNELLYTKTQQLRTSSPTLIQGFKWVAIERATHNEFSATKITQIIGGERRKSKEDMIG